MSRGLGSVEKEILEALSGVTRGPVGTPWNSVEVWDSARSLGWETSTRTMTPAQSSSFRRAVRALERKGFVEVQVLEPKLTQTVKIEGYSEGAGGKRSRLFVRLPMTEQGLRAVAAKHRRAVRVELDRLVRAVAQDRLVSPGIYNPPSRRISRRGRLDDDTEFFTWYQTCYKPVGEGRYYDEKESRTAGLAPTTRVQDVSASILSGRTLVLSAPPDR